MKKFLLSLVAVAAALTASAGTGTPYWFTVNVETEAQPTGAGKVYCSFESSDAAKANESTSATRHFSANVSNNNWAGVTQSVLLYAEGEGDYAFDHYEVDGRQISVTEGDYGTQYRITMTQANNCGAGSLSEDDCIAQHREDLSSVVTRIVGVFKEVENCWFYTSASVAPVENGNVFVSFESSAAAAANQTTSASLHFNKTITPGRYDDVTKTLFVHAVADEGYELESLTVNGADMTAYLDEDGNAGSFISMRAANKCGNGNLSEDECLAQHAEDLAAKTNVTVTATFKLSPLTAINDVKVNDNNKVSKVIENGQVIIVKGDARYNTMGQSVK